MIQLDDTLYVGKGINRVCYRHPSDPGKCLKIDKRKHGGPTEKEAHYYKKLARIRPLMEYTFIPRFYGFVDTDLGRGGVFDLIQDEGTSDVSQTFRHYINHGQVTAENPIWIAAHSTFLQNLYEEAIIIRDFNASNICARKMLDGSYQLIAIDGIGHRDFIPLCDYFRSIARRKLRRHIERKGMQSLPTLLSRLEERNRIGKKLPLSKG